MKGGYKLRGQQITKTTPPLRGLALAPASQTLTGLALPQARPVATTPLGSAYPSTLVGAELGLVRCPILKHNEILAFCSFGRPIT